MNNSIHPSLILPLEQADLLRAFEERLSHLSPEERNPQMETFLLAWFQAGARWAESTIFPDQKET